MKEASRLNDILMRDAPAAGRCLSPLARRSAFPKGIPYQSVQARDTEINASIGQVTDGKGNPLPLPGMSGAVTGLDPRMTFLYSSQEGHAAVRQAWGRRQRRLSGSDAPVSTPMVVHGLTQAVSLVADLFGDEDTDAIIPDPCWENYHLIFGLRPGARIVAYPFYVDGRFNVDGLADVLARTTRKAIIVVNFPANPAGYSPTPEEARRLVEVLCAHRGPAVVLFDDAYQGMVYEDGLVKRSVFWDVVERCDPERLFPVKADGATKELFFFGGRIAFLTAAVTGEAEDALLSKWKCVARSSVGVTAGPSQALVLAGLTDPRLDDSIAERLELLRSRYLALREAVNGMTTARVQAMPFNSGCFALLRLDPAIPAEEFRLRLIRDASVGTISIPSLNAIRVAYCSVATPLLGEMVRRIEHTAERW
jgi:aspartate/methionine/tyrosine aminotransferase